MASFLFIAGVTGAIVAWHDEIDAWLNPRFFESTGTGPPRPALELLRLVEQRDPRARVISIPLTTGDGASVSMFVVGRIDRATGRQYRLGYNQVFIDPVTGAELGRRDRGAAWPITKETFVSFLLRLHYSLHMPELWGINRWGRWFMGGIALIWLLDCFVGLYLTMPARKASKKERAVSVERSLAKGFWARWKPAWQIKTRGSAYRINFDIHRAFSLWTWTALLILAFTSVSLNLHREVFFPLISSVSPVTPTPYDLRTATDRHHPIEPKLSFTEILSLAKIEVERRGWSTPIGELTYSPQHGIYQVRILPSGAGHSATDADQQRLYYDGMDGHVIADQQPWTGTAADIFIQAQFPLHSGRIFGLPGRILISFMGLVVAALSVTGVLIWWRKRKARDARRRDAPAE